MPPHFYKASFIWLLLMNMHIFLSKWIQLLLSLVSKNLILIIETTLKPWILVKDSFYNPEVDLHRGSAYNNWFIPYLKPTDLITIMGRHFSCCNLDLHQRKKKKKKRKRHPLPASGFLQHMKELGHIMYRNKTPVLTFPDWKGCPGNIK